MTKPALVLAALAAAAGPARADGTPLDDQLAAIDAGDAAQVIAQLRPRAAELDASGRCALGLALATTRDRARALIYLPSCGGGLPTAVAERAEAARAKLVAAADKAGDAKVDILTGAAIGLPIAIDRYAGDVVLGPATLWLPAGEYTFTLQLPDHTALVQQQRLIKRTSASVLFEPGPIAAEPPPPPTQHLDFSDGEPDAAATYVGAPPKQDHPSMLPDRYHLKQNRDVDGLDALAPPPHPIHTTLGVRAGGGVIDTGAGGATGAPSVAAIARAVVAGGWLAGELRVDAGPRGSDAAKTWTVGVAAQARWYPAEYTALHGLSLAAGPRVEIRTRDAIDGMAVDRFGIAAAAGVGWEPGSKRFAVELRGEQSLTALAGARPHAVLVELGVNL